MAHRLILNSITSKTQDWICKIQVTDKFPSRGIRDKAKKYQQLLLQNEEVVLPFLPLCFIIIFYCFNCL
ncbi:hypothetical protein R3W88_019168 [Solanum pinnatisectum]|uniref:Uncharacterized protein n=1 Tax=Solanum pinnatisectum TaxID=50273 RepID=A0AAV9KIJ8_9SOLN|nr:hypothetical protein R3W88_019168 [Solanum pinnatisectum]